MVEDRTNKSARAGPLVELNRLVEEIHQIMRERSMGPWLEAELIGIVKKAWRRVEEAEG